MAVKVGAAADAPTRTNAQGVPAGTSALTVFMRIYQVATSSFGAIFSFGSATNEQLLQTDSPGTSIIATSKSGATATVLAISLKRWIDVAYVYTGTTAGTLTGYAAYRGVPTISSASPTGGGDVTGSPAMSFGKDVSAEFWNGAIEDVRIWTRALTVDQLRAERLSTGRPASFDSIWMWQPLRGVDAVDESGQKRLLTMPSTTKNAWRYPPMFPLIKGDRLANAVAATGWGPLLGQYRNRRVRTE